MLWNHSWMMQNLSSNIHKTPLGNSMQLALHAQRLASRTPLLGTGLSRPPSSLGIRTKKSLVLSPTFWEFSLSHFLGAFSLPLFGRSQGPGFPFPGTTNAAQFRQTNAACFGFLGSSLKVKDVMTSAVSCKKLFRDHLITGDQPVRAPLQAVACFSTP